MLTNMSPGIFYPGTGPLHRLQARTKLLMIGLAVVVMLIANQHQWHFAPYIVAVTWVLGSIFGAGIGLRELWRRLSFLLMLVFSSLLFTFLGGSSSSPAVWTLGPWLLRNVTISHIALFLAIGCGILALACLLPPLAKRYRSRFFFRLLRSILILVTCGALLLFGWTMGLPPQHTVPLGPIIITRQRIWILVVSFVIFMALYTFSTLLTMTTNPVALIEGLTILLSPLRRLKLPVDDFALMALLGLRFIPTLLDEVEQLQKAQAARGADLLHGTWRERLQSFSSFFTALIQGTLRRAADLATALESRGYRSSGQRTLLYEKPLRRLDYLILIIFGLSMLGSLFF
ncbi:energy-coupling factor transporter transmembrane component T family protein [Dictyobacter arantiisoli]|uniref:Energy-coupling factor transporter transmembrane protein EcfT n=1 Tax=Dictyobacter arantiisoli TaxID=2014874 RepID=A0A5A5TK80_9CHLR|nr:energy-coupling factor transporter transmembrane component T [Dictyobacter arantiisoli]GCF11682.1 hypothetical protein KDI_52460 [Dictyobacter arantiisoli]